MSTADVARAFTPYLATAHGREILRDLGLEQGTPIVLAHEDDVIEGVLRRVTSHESHERVAIAVYADEGFSFVVMTPSPIEDDQDIPVNVRSSIGMLVTFLRTQPVESVRVRWTTWMATESSMREVNA